MRTNIRNSDFDYRDVKKIIFFENLIERKFIDKGTKNSQPLALAYYKKENKIRNSMVCEYALI